MSAEKVRFHLIPRDFSHRFSATGAARAHCDPGLFLAKRGKRHWILLAALPRFLRSPVIAWLLAFAFVAEAGYMAYVSMSAPVKVEFLRSDS